MCSFQMFQHRIRQSRQSRLYMRTTTLTCVLHVQTDAQKLQRFERFYTLEDLFWFYFRLDLAPFNCLSRTVDYCDQLSGMLSELRTLDHALSAVRTGFTLRKQDLCRCKGLQRPLVIRGEVS